MTGEFHHPDRFGCGAVAMAIFVTLFLFVLILAIVNEDFGQSLQNFFNGQQQNGQAGPGEDADAIPPVSDRYYSSGDANATVGGALQLADQIALDPVASYSQDGLSWISFHDGGPTEVLVVFNEPENSVTVAQGSRVAIGRDEACNFDIEVTGSSVSGTVSCASVEVLVAEEAAGTASIDLRFSTVTTPMEGDGSAPDDGG